MISKIFFGLFAFSLGLVIGIYLHGTILSFFPEDTFKDDALVAAVLLFVVLFFFLLWRVAERFSKKESTEGNLNKE